MSRVGRGGRARRERGAAAVEFALIVPVLMLLVFGIINYGHMLSVRQSVSQAAAEGARAAAVEPGDAAKKTASATAAVADALGAHNQVCAPTVCSVTIDKCPGEAAKQCATVKVEISYQALIPGFGAVLPERLKYTARARVS
ncbi:pilus assembly protein [Nocardioides sp. zg-ZUI104]|uniref:TadE family protein n=1 Tax=Nocardioides faecalis TaxID=2803858 RepID=UPI001BCC5632|nr:TadE/TadG family type IV pilus assembly protein [Nocardioides faecalis]MBS4751335.1 pilus assembly protein [Nocardioides faecalis]